MGCDIHFFTERKTTDDNPFAPIMLNEERDRLINDIINIDKEPVERWVSADKWTYHADYNDDFDDMGGHWSVDSLFYQRNYYLFGLLAGVRDRYVEPIDYPRGIPEDASSTYEFMCEQYFDDAHSHSYFTLEELMEVDWNKYNTGEYKGWLNSFLSVIEKMKKIDPDPSKVRCCFFFDN